jgi:hypothetical protein
VGTVFFEIVFREARGRGPPADRDCRSRSACGSKAVKTHEPVGQGLPIVQRATLDGGC